MPSSLGILGFSTLKKKDNENILLTILKILNVDKFLACNNGKILHPLDPQHLNPCGENNRSARFHLKTRDSATFLCTARKLLSSLTASGYKTINLSLLLM